jgi:hypothetical protein
VGKAQAKTMPKHITDEHVFPLVNKKNKHIERYNEWNEIYKFQIFTIPYQLN